MKKLIIHVGPGKCGSSSIQRFFGSFKNSCVQKIDFAILPPQEIEKLNTETHADNTEFINYLEDKFSSCETVILSHEYLFQCPNAIKNICNLSKEMVAETIVIGYSRSQSDFLVSAYSQWLFRSKRRIEEIKEVLLENSINPIIFTGLERQFIASILNDFYSARQLKGQQIMDWYKSYSEIEKLVANTNVKIKPGVLPRGNFQFNLIEDFCEKAGLTIKENFKDATTLKRNMKFNDYIVEAINSAIESGLAVPGPHDSNKIIRIISRKLKSNNKEIQSTNNFLKENEDFLNKLKQYTDEFYFASNSKFCESYHIDQNYFLSSSKYSKDEIIEIIKKKALERNTNHSMVKFYKGLSGILAQITIQVNEK